MLLYNMLKYSRGNYTLHYGRFSLSLDCCACFRIITTDCKSHPVQLGLC